MEYNHDSGIKTGLIHQCPNRPKQSQQQSHEQIAFKGNLQTSQQPQPTKQASTTIVTQATQNGMIIKKADRIISALESQNCMIGLLLDKEQKEKLKEYEQTMAK